MARFFRSFANYVRPSRGAAGTLLSFSAVTSFQEKGLQPVDRDKDKALKLEDFPEKWSHKFLLQQSRQVELVFQEV